MDMNQSFINISLNLHLIFILIFIHENYPWIKVSSYFIESSFDLHSHHLHRWAFSESLPRSQVSVFFLSKIQEIQTAFWLKLLQVLDARGRWRGWRLLYIGDNKTTSIIGKSHLFFFCVVPLVTNLIVREDWKIHTCGLPKKPSWVSPWKPPGVASQFLPTLILAPLGIHRTWSINFERFVPLPPPVAMYVLRCYTAWNFMNKN